MLESSPICRIRQRPFFKFVHCWYLQVDCFSWKFVYRPFQVFPFKYFSHSQKSFTCLPCTVSLFRLSVGLQSSCRQRNYSRELPSAEINYRRNTDSCLCAHSWRLGYDILTKHVTGRVTLWRIFSFEKLYRCLIFPLYLWFGHVTMATTGASPCHGLTTCYTVSQAMFTVSKTADDPRILPLLYPTLPRAPIVATRVSTRSIVWKVSVLALFQSDLPHHSWHYTLAAMQSVLFKIII